jgi:hypothetical protein
MENRVRSLQFQYLGISGDTSSCTDAIISILVSPVRASHFTVVFCEWNKIEEDHTAACFVAWNWLGAPITIIADGFGTHQGYGGWGLSLCLALIQSSNIRIDEVEISSSSFQRIAKGRAINNDIKKLTVQQYERPMWTLYVRDFHSKAVEDGTIWTYIQGDSSDLTNRFPSWMFDPEVHHVAKTFESSPSVAVTEALLKLEDFVRRLSKSERSTVGVKLMGNAFGKEGKLRFNLPEDEADAWASLYRGIFGAIRNPLSHHVFELESDEAIRYLILTDLLIRRLKKGQEKPKKKDLKTIAGIAESMRSENMFP